MHQPTNSTYSVTPRVHSALEYHISAKSNNLRRSYFNSNMSNFSTVRHLGSDRKWTFTVMWPSVSDR